MENTPLWPFEDGETFKAAEQFHTTSIDTLVAPCAHRGTTTDALHESIIDIHRMSRTEYAANIRKVGRNVFPLIIARDTQPDHDPLDVGRQGLGGIFTLYLASGESRTIRPTPPAYERLKCLSHIPLGLFTLLSPHFNDANALLWHPKVAAMGTKINEALRRIEIDGLGPKEREIALPILERSNAYVSEILATEEISVQGFEAFAKSLRPEIHAAMNLAAELQMDACMTALKVWRKELGPNEWRKLHVMVTTIWPVSEHSPRWQLFRTLMDPETVDTHLIVGEGVKTTEEARDLLGRIVADRLASRLIIGTETECARRATQSLSSRTDVIADSAYRALQRHCPVAPKPSKDKQAAPSETLP